MNYTIDITMTGDDWQTMTEAVKTAVYLHHQTGQIITIYYDDPKTSFDRSTVASVDSAGVHFNERDYFTKYEAPYVYNNWAAHYTWCLGEQQQAAA